jgi:hypothetical protein
MKPEDLLCSHMFSTQLNSVDIPQTFPLGSDFPFFRKLSVTNRKCYSCICNSGTKFLLHFGLGVLDETRFPAAGDRNPTVQYTASHCSLLKFLFKPLAISLVAFLVMCVHIPITEEKKKVHILFSLTFSFQVSSICATHLFGGVNRSFVYLVVKLRLQYEMTLLCSCQVPNIYTPSADKIGSWSVCVHSFMFFFGFQIVNCSWMKAQRNPIFRIYLKRYMPFGKIYAAYRRR